MDLRIRSKCGDKIISVYWFVILFIVVAGVVYMVFSFYGKPYDIREAEANSLVNLVARCLTDGGYLTEGIVSEGVLSPDFKENFLRNCHITFEVEDTFGWKEQKQYYLKIKIYDFISGNLVGEVKEGNEGLEFFCDKKGENFPVCLERSLYTIDNKNRQYKINIFSIVKKTEKNAI